MPAGNGELQPHNLGDGCTPRLTWWVSELSGSEAPPWAGLLTPRRRRACWGGDDRVWGARGGWGDDALEEMWNVNLPLVVELPHRSREVSMESRGPSRNGNLADVESSFSLFDQATSGTFGFDSMLGTDDVQVMDSGPGAPPHVLTSNEAVEDELDTGWGHQFIQIDAMLTRIGLG